ncbi:hypothetical protein HY251_17970 [bacterium]|nr:hypothetical protein [bacterium]
MFKDKKTKERLDLADRLATGLSVLGLNQGLVQFADSKANGLLLIDSILLAVMVPHIGVLHSGAPIYMRCVFGAFFGACALALVAALRVIVARAPETGERRPTSIVFFKHIASLGRAHDYVELFRDSEGESVLESVLISSYDLATIARAKFQAYKQAEKLTMLSTLLLVAALVVMVV